jgi:RNA polymerase sigma-70 factor (ECF subfamily)
VIESLPRHSLSVAAEAVVVACAIAGDDAAFGELVRRRQTQIRNLLRRLCRDPALADDLSQNTFVQAWRRLKTLQAPGAFGGWLRTLAVNVWLQHARTRKSQSDVTADGALPERAQLPTIAEQMDLDRALALLPPHVRLCIVLGYAERMSHREICQATGFPLGTVKSHITRGAALLREILSAYGTQMSATAMGEHNG